MSRLTRSHNNETSVKISTVGKVKTLTIDGHSPLMGVKRLNLQNVNISAVAYLMFNPSVEEVRLDNVNFNSMMDLGKPLPGDASGDGSNVSKIELCYCSIDERGLEDILTTFPKLKELVFYRPYNEFEDNETEYHGLGETLNNFGGKLESLSIYNESLMPFETPFGSLAKMTSLKSLDMVLEMLIGFHVNPRGGYDEYLDAPIEEDEEPPNYDDVYAEVGDWSLVELLPESLEFLTLEVECPKMYEYFNTYERYGAKFEELFRANMRFKHLRCVRAPRLEEVAKNLQNRLTGWELRGGSMIRIPSI